MMWIQRVTVIGALLVATAAPGISSQAQSQPPADVQLRAARQLEEVTGDLKAAIEAYRKLSTSSDRAIAAEALLRLAGCQEKLGQAEAQRTYRDVIAKFADQAAVAAEARRRVAATTASAGARTTGDGPRLVWTIPDNPEVRLLGPVSGNGRYIPIFTDSNLYVRDLVAGIDRLVPRSASDEALRAAGVFRVDESVLSRDGRRLVSRVAVSRVNGGLRFTQLRITELGDVTGPPQMRVLLDRTDVVPYDWTPDGKSIAVRRKGDGRTEDVAIVSAEDGSVRVLKTLEWRADTSPSLFPSLFAGVLSPDGRQLAIEIPTNVSGSRDIVVVPVDGGPEVPAVEWAGDDILLGWSPDGTSLLFSSARGSGALDIWRQRFDAGRPKGSPDLVRRGAPARPLGMTTGGALYSSDNVEGPEKCWTAPACGVKEAVFDFDSGAFISPPRDVSATLVRSNEAPRWSPDGTRLGYFANRGGRDDVLVIKNIQTGDAGELRLNFHFSGRNIHRWDWMPDGQSILAQGQNVDRGGSDLALHRIDLTTGRVSLVLPQVGNTWFRYISWSPDGKTLYYHRDRDRSVPLAPGQPFNQIRVAHDVSSGKETDLFPDSPFAQWHGTNVYDSRRMSGGFSLFERNTLSGGEREIVRIHGNSSGFLLTTDGRSLVTVTTDLTTTEPLVVLCSVADGSVKTLFRGERGREARVELLARDERSAIVRSTTREGTTVYWWVPFDGRPAKQLEELAGVNLIEVGARERTIELNPDGRRLAFGVAYPRTAPDQIQVLENFLPAVKR